MKITNQRIDEMATLMLDLLAQNGIDPVTRIQELEATWEQLDLTKQRVVRRMKFLIDPEKDTIVMLRRVD